MSKLYPPTIETPLAAFYDVSAVTVPIIDNKTVSKTEIAGYSLQIKHAVSGAVIGTVTSNTTTFDLSGLITTNIEDEVVSRFTPGTFYKFQIAYLDRNESVGYYSSIAVVKYTYKPSFDNDEKNNQFIVNYENLDNDEKIYEYSFQLYRIKTEELLEDTGYLIHRRDNDVLEEDSTTGQLKLKSFDSFTISEDLNEEELFKIIYSYKTLNGLAGSLSFTILGIPKASSKIFDDNLVKIKVSADRENGATDITVIFDETSLPDRNGSYLIKRAKIKNNITMLMYDDIYPWESIYTFDLGFQDTRLTVTYKDLTVENGEKYIYSLSQYNANGIYSTKIYSNIIIIKFDYMYLYDGERQLAIKYNPEMNSFKNDILEQKVETIGRKYPFIYRNGIVKYKEFPVGGLISESLDPDGLFLSRQKEELQVRINTKSNQYTAKEVDEYYNEKVFKLKVLEWLSNGKPKLFKSITEGNYLITLINVSLSPEEKLGRLLHKFSSTAYEIAALTDANLREYGILSYSEEASDGFSASSISNFVNLNTITQDTVIFSTENLMDAKNVGIYIVGALPNTQLVLTTRDNEVININIGLTGKFILEPGQVDIKELKILNSGSEPLKGTANIIAIALKAIDFYLIDEVSKDKDIQTTYFEGNNNDIFEDIAGMKGNTFIDVRYVAKLQIFRKYNLDNQSYNVTAKLSFTGDSDVQIIDLSERDKYEVNNIMKLSSLILGDGLIAILYYKRVNTHYNEGVS